MKKILFSALAAIGLLFTPACSDESELLNTGNEELVTFTVSVADGLQTKATISDGKKAKWLVYEVYEANDADKQVVHGTAQLQESADSWTIQLKLVKEKQYDIAFWAQTQDPSNTSGYYNVSNLRAVGINYSQATNIEERDAFCHIEPNYEVSSTTPTTVQLKRPFAQLNFLASGDHITDAKKAGLNFAGDPTAAVTVEDVADTYDVLTGAATASTQSVTATFTEEIIPFASAVSSGMRGAESHIINGIPYYFIATNYILPVDDGTGNGSTVDATLIVNGGTVYNAQTVVANAPVKPNHRTNIYGHLLTAEGTFNVEIKPGFAGDQQPIETPVTPGPNPSETTASVDTYAKLTAALDKPNITTITLTDDIELTENLTINRDVTIDGGETSQYGFKDYNGTRNTLSVRSGSDVTFDNVSFTNSMYALSATDYAGKLTIKNCRFYVDGETGNASTNGSISIGTASSGAVIVIENNTFTNGKLTRAAGGPPAAGKYIEISSSNTNCTNTIRIVGNTFNDGNLSAYLEILNQSAATTTIGNNIIPNDVSKISVSFHGIAGLTNDSFLAAFKGNTETLVSDIIPSN